SDDGNDAARLFDGTGGRRTQCDNDIELALHQLSSHFPQPVGIRFSKDAVDGEVLPFHVAKLAQAGHQRIESDPTCVGALGAAGRHNADASDLGPLLRARRERPRRRAAKQRDEFAALHSITSSAMASSEGGTMRSSMRAVCELMTSSNLVACTIGKSAGFAPLRTRPT